MILRQNKLKKLLVVALTASILSSSVFATKSIQAKEVEKVQAKQEQKVSNQKFKTSNSTCEAWGLGKELTEEVSNDRDYEWYVNQYRTGEWSYINCGAASAEMAIKWVNKDSDIKAEQIRNKFIPKKQGTFPDKMAEILTSNNINNRQLDDWRERVRNSKFKENITEEERKRAQKVYSADFYYTLEEQNKMKEDIKQKVKDGDLVLVGLYTSNLTVNPNIEQRTGVYYYGFFPHWVVIKGYKVVDNKLYFEVYDPIGGMEIGYEARYDDGTLVGKNRYYLGDEVVKGYMYGVVVKK